MRGKARLEGWKLENRRNEEKKKARMDRKNEG